MTGDGTGSAATATDPLGGLGAHRREPVHAAEVVHAGATSARREAGDPFPPQRPRLNCSKTFDISENSEETWETWGSQRVAWQASLHIRSLS